MSAPSALQQAIRLRDQPALLTDLQRAPLPPDMGGLIRIATGDAAASESERMAAAGFLEQICLHADADPRRRLALLAHDDLLVARTHHRLLIKWLHPDRNPDHQVLAERVNSAWTSLKNPVPMAPAEFPDMAVMPVRRSRFPLFLGVLLLAASALLVVSLMPDAPVYVDGAEQAKEPAVPAADATLAKALAALPLSPVKLAPPKTAFVPAPAVAVNAALPRPVATTVPAKPVPMAASSLASTEKPTVSAPKPIPPAQRSESIPAPVPKPIAVNAPVADALSAAEAEAVVQQFSTHYSAGNLQGLMALFSPKAISLKGGREAIAADYSRLFNSTRQRRIALSNARWQAVDDARRLRAGFQTELAYDAGRAPQRRNGSIEMLLVRENGNPRILELLITE
jgi:hypothetical protein